MGRPDAECLQLGDRDEPSAVLPAQPSKLPASVCHPETTTAKTEVSTMCGPEPLQTQGMAESLAVRPS